MNRRSFLQIAGGSAPLLAFTPAIFSKAASLPPKPNILMILVDDLGYGDLSCYGAKDLQTPNIDKLMRNGMRFNNFYANCPVCSPTRASLLTGRYPDLVGVPGVIRTHLTSNFGYLSPDAQLLPAMLKSAGYHTALIGKWHLGLEPPNLPNERGFDLFRGFLGDMMDDYYTHLRHNINYMRRNRETINPEGHATDLFTRWAVDFIKEQASRKDPFFLYLAYNAPHTPVQPPETWLKKVKTREAGISEKRAKLVALIEHLDAGIGEVIQSLKKSGQAQNTLIVFASDNGGKLSAGANNGKLRGGKQDMFEGGIRVPACAVWPGKIKPGVISHTVALTMDLFPTFCQAAGVSISQKIDGKSLLPEFLGKTGKIAKERVLFWVRREGGKYGGRAYYAARKGRWKLVQNTPYEAPRLFDLQNDPLEQTPLNSQTPAYRELFGVLRNHIIETGAVPWQKYPVKF